MSACTGGTDNHTHTHHPSHIPHPHHPRPHTHTPTTPCRDVLSADPLLNTLETEAMATGGDARVSDPRHTHSASEVLVHSRHLHTSFYHDFIIYTAIIIAEATASLQGS